MIKNDMLSMEMKAWTQLFRIPKLEELRPHARLQRGEVATSVEPSFGEIADANFKEMERTTVEKWTLALNRMFHLPEAQNLKLHNPDGRIKVAMPGCYLGLETGALLDFFNDQNLPVDIEAVDTGVAGVENKFMDLDQRQSKLGSSVTFHSETDATKFFAEKP
jgi:hypothetical protein